MSRFILKRIWQGSEDLLPIFGFPAPKSYKPVLRDILLDYSSSEGAFYSEHKRKIFELLPPDGYWRDIPEEIAKEYMKSCWEMEGGRTGVLRRLSLDEPSLTILTSPSQKQTERCHPLNKNLINPVKFIFDKMVYRSS